MAKYSKIMQLKIDTFKKYMEDLGYNVKAFSEKEIKTMATEAFKSYDNKQLKSFGTKYVRENGQLVLKKVEGQIRSRQLEQIKQFTAANVGDDIRTFGQIIADENIKEFYGYDVFDFIKENKITNYDISQGTYFDPLTGELKSFGG